MHIPKKAKSLLFREIAASSAEDKTRRAQALYHPFHDAIVDLMDRRREAGRPIVLVTVHSFTPVYFGEPARWRAGNSA
jgi:predicted N-formylglutamate amidohydrolase